MKKRIFGMLLALSVGLTGCGGVQVVPRDADGQTGVGKVEKIHTPETEKVVLNVVDWSDSTKAAREQLNARFMEDHPNVTVNYTTLTQAQFNETMLSGIRSGDAPDLFPLPSTVTFSTAVNEGWFIPMNLYLEEAFFDAFQPEFLSQNITMKGEDIYLLPEAVDIPSSMIFYNKTLLREAGVTDDVEQMDWETFRQVCRKVTENGKGKYYGIIASGAQKNRMDIELRAFAEVAGAKLGQAGQILLKQGENTFAAPEVMRAFDFYQSLCDDKSFHPDTGALSAPEARKLFGEGKAAFIMQGSWCIPIWEQENPALAFGVMKVPAPKGMEQEKTIRPFVKGWMGISSSSKHPDVAAEYLRYLYSYEYQQQLMAQGGFISIRKDLGEADIQNETMRRYYRCAMEQSVSYQDPVAENENIELVYGVIQPVAPDFGDIAASLFSGRKGYTADLQKYAQQMQQNLTRAVDSVGKKVEIALSDFDYKEENVS